MQRTESLKLGSWHGQLPDQTILIGERQACPVLCSFLWVLSKIGSTNATKSDFRASGASLTETPPTLWDILFSSLPVPGGATRRGLLGDGLAKVGIQAQLLCPPITCEAVLKGGVFGVVELFMEWRPIKPQVLGSGESSNLRSQ